MQKWISLFMTFLVAGSISYASANTGQVVFEAGYRHDDISWRNHFPSSDPFVSQGTRFEDIDIFQVGLRGRAAVGCNFYVRGDVYYGYILDGNFKKSDSLFGEFGDGYGQSDNVQIGVKESRRGIIDDKCVYGVGAGIGYPFFFCDCTMVVAPVIGYSFDEQNLQVEDKGSELLFIDGSGSDTGCGGCCNRSFISRWYGPFVGVDFDYRPWNSCLNLYAELEYHWGCFQGRRSMKDGDIDTYNSLKQHSDNARGWVFDVGFDYDLCNHWAVGVALKFQSWTASAHNGTSAGVESSSGSTEYGFHNRNNSKWHSYAVNLVLGRDF